MTSKFQDLYDLREREWTRREIALYEALQKKRRRAQMWHRNRGKLLTVSLIALSSVVVGLIFLLAQR